MGQAYSDNFEPVLLPNETALLRGSNFPDEGQAVRCRAVGALPEYLNNFGALTANTWLSDQQDTNLDMPAGELAQYRMRIMGDFQLQILNPSSVTQWRSLSQTFYLRKWPVNDEDAVLKIYLFKASEFFVYGNDNSPRFSLRAAVAQDTSRVIFSGWRYKLQNIDKIKLTSKVEIWVNSWPSSK